MMLIEKLQTVYCKKEDLQRAEEDLYRYVDPILAELGVTWGNTSDVYIDGDVVRIVRSGSCRGHVSSDEYAFPLSIFLSMDSIDAAKSFKKDRDTAKAKALYAAKISAIEELMKSLEPK